jgi:uncharacterized protein YndB with AHSA1/START domain
VREWFTPKPLATGECRVDFRPGGEWAHEMALPDGRAHTMRARYIRIDPPDRLVFEATIVGMEPSVILTSVSLEDEGGKTRLRVHQLFQADSGLDAARAGWALTDLRRVQISTTDGRGTYGCRIRVVSRRSNCLDGVAAARPTGRSAGGMATPPA